MTLSSCPLSIFCSRGTPPSQPTLGLSRATEGGWSIAGVATVWDLLPLSHSIWARHYWFKAGLPVPIERLSMSHCIEALSFLKQGLQQQLNFNLCLNVLRHVHLYLNVPHSRPPRSMLTSCARPPLQMFITLDENPRRPLGLEFSDTQVYEP